MNTIEGIFMLSLLEIRRVNQLLARELIESRLDAPATEDNINKIANAIAEIEA